MIIERCIQFFNTYHVFVAVFMFCGLAFYVTANTFANPYRKQNRAFTHAIRKMLTNPHSRFVDINLLTDEYRRQWRAFCCGHADKPSSVMEFVPLKNKPKLLLLLVCASVCAASFVAAFVFDLTKTVYVAVALVYFSLVAHAFVIVRYARAVKQRNARRLFGKFVALLNRHAVLPTLNDFGTIDKLTRLSDCIVDEHAAERAATILHDAGLTCQRTVDEQRKINRAVNGFLQTYAKSFVK